MLAISGIMVDGFSNLCGLFPTERHGPDTKNTTMEQKHKETMFDQQKFDNADLVVIGSANCKEAYAQENKRTERIRKNNPDYKPATEVFNYPMWAVYGNTVVESAIHKGNIKELREHTKVIWSYKKPYILNGD